MKRILALICLLLSFVMTACIFCGCGAANDLLDGSQNLQNNPSTQHVSTQTTPTSIPTAPITEPTQPTTVPTQLEAPGVELEAQADSSVEPYPYPNRVNNFIDSTIEVTDAEGNKTVLGLTEEQKADVSYYSPI